MLNYREIGIIIEIKDKCSRINSKVYPITKTIYDSNLDIREIIVFNLYLIGELAKKLSFETCEKYNKVPWKKIKGLRDCIGHGYDDIDTDKIWEIAFKEVPELEHYCQEILDNN